MSDDRIQAWADEDGDRWFAVGHVSDDEMRAAAARAESEALSREVTASDFADGSVSRGWFRPLDPDDDESPMRACVENESGAQAWTVLYASVDWDSIDARPKRRPGEPSA